MATELRFTETLIFLQEMDEAGTDSCLSSRLSHYSLVYNYC